MSGNPGRSGTVIRLTLAGAIVIVLMFFFVFAGGSTWPLQTLFHAVAGPVLHGWKNLPTFLEKWPQVIPPLVCLALACVFGHRFIRWWVTATGDRIPWRAAHTITTFSLLLLGSAAAIAFSGVIHQGVWLLSSPWTVRNYNQPLIIARMDARNILLSVLAYEGEHDKYPESLAGAVDRFTDREILWLEPATGAPREPFVLVRPGAEEIGVTLPLIVSPWISRGDSVAVGYTDGEVRILKSEEWEREITRLRTYE